MSVQMKDILIIGGGPAGYEAAIEGSKLGHKITLVDAHKIGGTCLHYGCIPTKTMQHAAKFFGEINAANESEIGVSVKDVSLDYSKIIVNKLKVISKLEAGILKQLKALKVNVIMGKATLNDDYVSIETSDGEIQLKPEITIIATGSEPKRLNLSGNGFEQIMTSKDLLAMEKIPDSLTIIGAGVIGMEFAFIYKKIGSKVTVIEYMDSILPSQDTGISKRLQSMAKKIGIDVITKAKVTGVDYVEDGFKVSYVKHNKESEVLSINCSDVLMAAGRKPNLKALNLEKWNIDTDGYKIIVDESFMTSKMNVYGIGDVIDKGMLAHVASYQGKWLMRHLAGEKSRYDHLIPSAIFTIPEVASVGYTENQLKELNINYNTYKTMYGALGKAHAINATEGFCKILSDENDVVIGVHLLGADASNLIQEGVIAIKKRMTVSELRQIIHVHPTLSEIYL